MHVPRATERALSLNAQHVASLKSAPVRTCVCACVRVKAPYICARATEWNWPGFHFPSYARGERALSFAGVRRC